MNMARKHRIEYRDAVYHVVNRGNYHQKIFLTPGSSELFEPVQRQSKL